jgi:hypothetical protein
VRQFLPAKQVGKNSIFYRDCGFAARDRRHDNSRESRVESALGIGSHTGSLFLRRHGPLRLRVSFAFAEVHDRCQQRPRAVRGMSVAYVSRVFESARTMSRPFVSYRSQ